MVEGLLIAWGIAGIGLWVHAMYLYRRVQRDCDRGMAMLDEAGELLALSRSLRAPSPPAGTERGSS